MAKILVVDDAKVMRITIKKQLEKLGHEVIAEAENGFEAIEQYKLYNPDLVTMDITMPEVNGISSGIEALVEIRNIDPNAKIIMVTSHGEENLVIEAISKGSKGYILKPIVQDKLQDIIEKLKT